MRGEGDPRQKRYYWLLVSTGDVTTARKKKKRNKRTCFGQIETLFEEVRDQAEQSDETPEGSTDDVEIGHRQGRHVGDRRCKDTRCALSTNMD